MNWNRHQFCLNPFLTAMPQGTGKDMTSLQRWCRGRGEGSLREPWESWTTSDEAGVVEGTDPDPTTPPYSHHMALVSRADTSSFPFTILQPGEREAACVWGKDRVFESITMNSFVKESIWERGEWIYESVCVERENLKRQTDRMSTTVSRQV